MGTRSNIAVMQPNGKIKDVYCHWDGYPSHNGKMLLTYYNSEEKANQLMELGDISALNERVAPNENETHSFDKPVNDVTIFYGRDRGETDVDCVEYSGLKSYKPDNEWAYLWMDGKWHFCQPYNGLNWEPLTESDVTKK